MRAWLLLVALLVCKLFAQDSPSDSGKPEGKKTLAGYANCSNQPDNQVVRTYLSPCEKLPGGNLTCGQGVKVIERYGTWLWIELPNGSPRYALASEISRQTDAFTPFGDDSGIPDFGTPNCSAPLRHGVQGPRLIFDPEPEYSDQARKKKIKGTVILSLVVGVDGLPHDIKVETKLGYGLDEKALEAVRRWKFQPALRDGQPVETSIHVSVSFKML